MSQNKGLEIIFEYDDNVNEIYSDPVKINQIVSNLLSNAVKYSNLKGQITILSNIENDCYELIFEDNGIGINQEDLKFVQERFFRIKNDSTLHISGSGLGLNIATQLAKMSDIKMQIESSQNIGTKIILTLNIENF